MSLSPGQPQQLLPPPFYPPPGVMTFPYPTMYPNPQVLMSEGGVEFTLIGSVVFLSLSLSLSTVSCSVQEQ